MEGNYEEFTSVVNFTVGDDSKGTVTIQLEFANRAEATNYYYGLLKTGFRRNGKLEVRVILRAALPY